MWWMTRRYQMVVPSAVRIARLDGVAEALGAAGAERQQADRLGIDALADPLADRLQAARPPSTTFMSSSS